MDKYNKGSERAQLSEGRDKNKDNNSELMKTFNKN